MTAALIQLAAFTIALSKLAAVVRCKLYHPVDHDAAEVAR